MAKRFSLALAVGILAATPVGAVKDLSDKGALPASNLVLFGSTHAIDSTSSSDRFAKGAQGTNPVSPAAEPANWLMMLIGFGLLGAMSRRSEMDRFRDEMVL